MGDSATTATSMTAPQHSRFEHDDPLALTDYGLSELRASMASFSDFPMAFGNAYDRPQANMHRGSIVDLDDGNVSAGSGHPHRGSIGSVGHLARDGNHTSPESAAGLGMLLGDALEDGSTLAMKLEDGMLREGADGSQKDRDGQDPPPWSEMKTKAGKERKRLPLACIACRRKKIRCSGEKPACKHCLRSRIPCVYKVTTRKAAPRTDYMAMLDKRLRRMEDRVIKLIPKESLPSVAGVGRSVVKPALPGAPPKTPTANKKRGAEEAFGNDLDEWAKSKSANPDVSGSASRNKEADDTSLLTEGAESLPPKDIQEHLAEVYFDYVYGQSYPLLHKPSFMRRLAKGDVPPVLILAICAISARFSTHPQLRSEPCFLRGDNWGEKAREIALRRYDAPNITILIVYLLLGLHEFGTCQGGRSWMFGGMAQRMAYALQLHKELEYDPSVPEPDRKPLSLTDREIRRRTMWSCFLMDRFNSSGTDRPLFVHEQYVEVQLPVKEHLYVHEIQAPTENLDGDVPNPVAPDSGQLSDPRENMGVTAYTIRLVCIWGKLIKYMNLGGKERETEPMWSPKSTFHIIKKEAKEFKDALPEMLVYSPENLKSHAIGRTANSYLYLHVLYQQIILFLHRFSLPSRAGSRPPKEMPHDFLTESARTALDAANQISILINEAIDHNVVAPFAGYSAFFSSTVHVHGVFSKNPKLEAQSKKYLAYNVRYLSKMKKYWGMFHYIAENLKELYRQHADAQLRGASASGEKGKAVIFQYGDWFDRYPHGVSKTDYEDAAEANTNEPGTDAVLGQKSDLQSVEEFFASLSPPTRAETHRKQARKSKKSVSKTDAPAAAVHAAAQQAQQRATQMHPNHLHRQLGQININPQDAIDAFDPAYFAQTNPQQYIQDFPHAHPNLTMLNTSPTTMIHPGQQMDLSPFPDLTPHASNASFWGLDHAGMGGNGFFDTGNAGWFLPFNVEPPVLGDDGGLFSPEAYNFGLGVGTPVGMGMNGHPGHRQSVGHGHGHGHGHGAPGGMEGLEGLDGGQ
ncbi:hypothetical protein GRF29_1g2277031 [Pseudopithomyces chartarum]|uniref:Zn(2)-C6 fungal-type domain-containing protein n=1 Tax=Pseudopithomyces chartarum TaxID=1892770 RepID=A0AAN6RN91_9PLEO|nr:hypothetical protein GRF29_1g2277031 [Pseudopithomyces chartarum]